MNKIRPQMHKTLAFLLALVMTTAIALPLTDATANTTQETIVEWSYDHGIVEPNSLQQAGRRQPVLRLPTHKTKRLLMWTTLTPRVYATGLPLQTQVTAGLTMGIDNLRFQAVLILTNCRTTYHHLL